MDKNKIIEAAAKLVAKGAYDKAIKEYQKVLDVDPKDVRVLQKMGELYQKKNENPQAAHYFTKVAESYSQDGFFLKAVALYKQVLKLNPGLMEVNLKLAELHQQLGLMSEAMAYFQIVANHHDQQGDTKASLDTLKKMVDLDPDNVASRIKLAELYARESMSKEALGEFKRAAEYLKRNNRGDDYLRVAERISTLEPENLALAKELAQGFLQKGDQKRALAKLQICFKADPRDVETLSLLAQAFQGLGQTSKTISVYKELAKIYAEKGRSDEEAQIWNRIRQIDPNDADLPSARSGPGAAAPAPAPAAPAPAPAPERPAPVPSRQMAAPPATTAPSMAAASPPAASMLQAVPTRPSQQAIAPPPAATPPAPSGRDQLSKLLTETDVYVKYGLHDKALEHLRKVFSIDPENLDAHEKAYHIYVGSNNAAQASEQLLNVLRLCTRRAEVQRAQPYLQTILSQNPGHPEVPAFLAVLRSADTRPPSAQQAQAADEEAILVDSSEEEIIVAEAPEDALAGAEDDLAIRAASSADEEEVVAEGAVLSDDTGPGDIPALEDEPLSGQEEPGEMVLEEEPVTSSYSPDMLARSREPSTLHDASPALEAPPTVEDDDDDAEPKTVLAQPGKLVVEELQAATTEPAFKRNPTAARPAVMAPEQRTQPELTQPNIRVARPEPKTLAVKAAERVPPQQEARGRASEGPTRIEQYPTRPEPARPAPPPKPAAAPAPAPAPAPAARAEKAKPAARAPAAPPPEEVAVEECDEAAFFIDQGLLEEAREILETVLVAYPNHPRAQALMERLAEQEGSGASPAMQDVPTDHSLPAVRPVDRTDPSGGKDAFDLAAELAGELDEAAGTDAGLPSADDFQYSVEEVFSEFKKGLEKVVKPEDVETHYDLGIAYKEMGLVDDAIGEMAQARQGCVGKKKEIDCLLMMGILQATKGDHQSAVDSFKEGLASEHAQGEAFKALAYELGTSYEALGKPGKALFWLQRISKLDPKYRDVSAAVQRLQAASARPEEDPLPVSRSAGGNGPANGVNGAHAGGGRGGPGPSGPSGGAAAPKPTDASGKARKVGYV